MFKKGDACSRPVRIVWLSWHKWLKLRNSSTVKFVSIFCLATLCQISFETLNLYDLMFSGLQYYLLLVNFLLACFWHHMFIWVKTNASQDRWNWVKVVTELIGPRNIFYEMFPKNSMKFLNFNSNVFGLQHFIIPNFRCSKSYALQLFFGFEIFW